MKLTILIGLCFGFFNNISWAFDLPEKRILCNKEIQSLLKGYSLEKGEWRKTLPDSISYDGWRFHPQTVGKWVELQKSSDQIILRKFNGENFLEAVSDKKCKFEFLPMKMSWYLEKIWKQKTDLDFDDIKLEKLLSENSKAVIYLWSPKFSYSLTFYNKAKATAEKLGYKFIPLLDPRANTSEAKAAQDVFFASGFKRDLASNFINSKMFSYDLFLRNGFNHFPVTFITGNKKIHPRFMTGLMTEEGMIKMVKDLEKEL